MAQSNRKKRSAYLKLIPSVLCIAVTLFAGLAASMAWFSMNDKVSASGMKVSLNTDDSSLVIAATEAELYSAKVSDTTVTYSEEKHSYVPVTHVNDEDTDDDYQLYLLKYISSGAGVDPDTGLDDDVNFTPVTTNTDGSDYYFAQFDVYIGSLNCTLTDVDLIAEWDEDAIPASMTDRQKAASVDFYVLKGGTYEYVTSTNLATKQSATLLQNVEIPNTQSAACIGVRMRFYYDGALTNEDGTVAYIRTGLVVDSDVSLGITFRAD